MSTTIKQLLPMENPQFKAGDKVCVTVGGQRQYGEVKDVDLYGYWVRYESGRAEMCWPDELSSLKS